MMLGHLIFCGALGAQFTLALKQHCSVKHVCTCCRNQTNTSQEKAPCHWGKFRKLSRIDKNDKCCSKLHKVAQSCTKLLKVAQSCPKLHKVTQSRTKMPNIAAKSHKNADCCAKSHKNDDCCAKLHVNFRLLCASLCNIMQCPPILSTLDNFGHFPL